MQYNNNQTTETIFICTTPTILFKVLVNYYYLIYSSNKLVIYLFDLRNDARTLILRTKYLCCHLSNLKFKKHHTKYFSNFNFLMLYLLPSILTLIIIKH